jgi:hypothetical protein
MPSNCHQQRHDWLAVSIDSIRRIFVVKNGVLGGDEFACIAIRFGGVIVISKHTCLFVVDNLEQQVNKVVE